MNLETLPFVHSYRDRHGKQRYYLRRRGYRAVPLPDPKDKAQFALAYAKAADAPPSSPKRGYVYFVAMGDHLKIGFAKNVKKRVADLQVGSPVPLEIVHVHGGSREDEIRLHEQFARYSANGEWFEKAPDIMRLIARLKTSWRDPIFSSWDDR